MKKTIAVILTVLGLSAAGCSTTARFIIPENTKLVVHGRKAVIVEQNVVVKTRPFFWSAFKGVDYQLVRGDSVVREGKLPTRFRVASIFWPPYAILYWPAGFRFSCYDLTQAVPTNCGPMETAPAQETETTGTVLSGPAESHP